MQELLFCTALTCTFYGSITDYASTAVHPLLTVKSRPLFELTYGSELTSICHSRERLQKPAILNLSPSISPSLSLSTSSQQLQWRSSANPVRLSDSSFAESTFPRSRWMHLWLPNLSSDLCFVSIRWPTSRLLFVRLLNHMMNFALSDECCTANMFHLIETSSGQDGIKW